MLLLEILSYATEVTTVAKEAWIPLVMAAISVGSAAYSTYKKADASNKLRDANESVRRQTNDLASVYKRESERDYFDTATGKSVTSQITKGLRDANKKTQDQAAAGGATQEAKVASKASNMQTYNNALQRVGQAGDAYKERMQSRYEGVLGGQLGINNATLGRDVDSWGNLQSNSFSTLSSSLASMDDETVKKITE